MTHSSSRNQPPWLPGRLTSLGSLQPPQLALLTFEKGFHAHCPFKTGLCAVARSCYLREERGVRAGQAHTSGRAGQPHHGRGQLPPPSPTNLHYFLSSLPWTGQYLNWELGAFVEPPVKWEPPEGFELERDKLWLIFSEDPSGCCVENRLKWAGLDVRPLKELLDTDAQTAHTTNQGLVLTKQQNLLWRRYNYNHVLFIKQKIESKKLGNCPSISSQYLVKSRSEPKHPGFRVHICNQLTLYRGHKSASDARCISKEESTWSNDDDMMWESRKKTRMILRCMSYHF